MAAERKLKALKQRLRSILVSFNLIKTFVDEYEEEQHEMEVPVRIEHLGTIWNDFTNVQSELEVCDNLDNPSIDQLLKQRAEFETNYYRVKGFLLAVNKAPDPVAASSSNLSTNFPGRYPHIRLPDVKIPVFNGNLECWLNFHDLFVSLVHASTEISTIQKFYYLRSSLTGDALKLIQSIPISANNYPVAWNLLVDHFQNPARLKQSYIDALFEFTALKRESATDLHSLVENFEATVKILNQLGEKTQYWDVMLIRMLSIRLDPTTRRDWEDFSSARNTISFQDLVAFIQRRVTVLQSIGNKIPEGLTQNPPRKSNPKSVSSLGAMQTFSRKCIICSENHPLYKCSQFSHMKIEDKEQEVRRHQLCRNCLRKGHMSRNCPSTSTCRKCNGHHHTQLCFKDHPKPDSKPERISPNPIDTHQLEPTTSAAASLIQATTTSINNGKLLKVVLATAVIQLVDDSGRVHTARALLDSGSECCFITDALSQAMKVNRTKISLPIAGIGHCATYAKYKLRATIRSRFNDYASLTEFLVLPKLTVELPSAAIDVSSWDLPTDVELADPSFNHPGPIDVVIGAEIFFELFKYRERISLGTTLPLLVKSELGWIVTGKTSFSQPITPIVSNVATISELHRFLERFWEIEEDDAKPGPSVDEAACENHFAETVARTDEGRYVVRLPTREIILSNLGDNRKSAVRRFHLLEGKIKRNETLHQQYRDFMNEYEDLKHMQKISFITGTLAQSYHLPHHAVIRESSSTTKLRVVFDASCKSATGYSLNDAVMVGPIIQDDLRAIITRSRMHPVMLIADIKQMYRQILVDTRDTPLQRIVWRNHDDEPLSTYELKTVTYGTACAPFLATRVLKQLANDEQRRFPSAAKILQRDFYMDDLFTGGQNIDEVRNLRKELEELCKLGGFELRKFGSNSTAVIDEVPMENRAIQSSVDLDRDPCIKTLGLNWDPSEDHLCYKIQLSCDPENFVLTKRIALSRIAQIFDPLGLLGPVIVSAKLFMQSLWTLKDEKDNTLNWDDPLPDALSKKWNLFYFKLPHLENLRIPRCVVFPNATSIELHIFSDASERAYGACAYVRSRDNNGCVRVALLTSRSKVAPLKRISIPRLELCGALHAAELYTKICSSTQLNCPTFFWVDSTTVLAWLNCSPSTWANFVANRVSKIQLATINSHWNHVPGSENPADHVSRGIPSEELLSCDIWWHGPAWLKEERDAWPSITTQPENSTDVLLEQRKSSMTTTLCSPEPSFVDDLIKGFSCYQHLLRVTAFCQRPAKIFRLSSNKRIPNCVLSVEEIIEAEKTLSRLVQQQTYEQELNHLRKEQPISPKSRLKWFSPFLGPDQLLRVGGRLANSNQNYDTQHQIILPSSHQITALLVEHLHRKHLHAAPTLLLTIIRLRFWIIGARSLTKKVVHKCLQCFKAKPTMVQQFMGELPRSRVTATRPFAVTGVDYWGPILLQPPHRRASPSKAFVAVFICFSTKAVHLELVPDLTTIKFLQAFKRFVARRGLCTDVYSDNGTNFVGAKNEIKRFLRSENHRAEVSQSCSEMQIRWHFNPPKASHFGGLWEAAIQSAQKHFIRVLGTRSLPYDDMETLLCQIECCLNSRPIVPLSDDPSDFDPLTPGHFLTGSALKAVPDRDFSDINYDRLKQWQKVQKIVQDIWKRWHLEYLSTLQPRTKWFRPPVTFQPGQLVLLRDENTPPMRWPTARIIDVHPGSDGIIRVVSLQTPKAKTTRCVQKICLLPIPPHQIQNDDKPDQLITTDDK
ncbi:uncharacterized protein LOC129752396 [Uranotaenia lowii]|uniref:uncharacterized protein LOC129752396 n=1 Tax=Uranotaenia lowii TaxID=190385 RepID=UPI00247A3525|nr:uncharacterized protein LOC129752396 [Uranotaenia lowii]